jgi:large subunit ribosomal protein L17
MRHATHHGRLGVQPAHRRAMIRNMVTSLLKYERIRTTKVRAKEVRRYAEKMITTAKKETLAAKRDVLGFVRERDVVNKLFIEGKTDKKEKSTDESISEVKSKGDKKKKETISSV